MTILFLAILAAICLIITFIFRVIAEILREKGFYKLACFIDGNPISCNIKNGQDKPYIKDLITYLNHADNIEQLAVDGKCKNIVTVCKDIKKDRYVIIRWENGIRQASINTGVLLTKEATLKQIDKCVKVLMHNG